MEERSDGRQARGAHSAALPPTSQDVEEPAAAETQGCSGWTLTWTGRGEGDGAMRRRALLQCFYAGVANRESASSINVSAC